MGKNSDNPWPKESYRERSNNNYDKTQPSQRGYRSNNRRSSDYQRNAPSSHSQQDDYNQQYSSFQYSNNNNDNVNQTSNEDYDYGDGSNSTSSDSRKYHRHHRHKSDHHRHRDRDRRSRSRSNDRDYRSDNTDNSNLYHHHQKNFEREDRYQNRQDIRKETPNNTLMVRNLPLHITDNDLTIEVNQFGVLPKDIRLMKNKETGQSRGFAFIEFGSIELATQFKELAQDYLTFGGEYECSLHYSFPKDSQAAVDKSNFKSDWSCPKCGINNFKRRDECFKCGTSRQELSPEDNYESKYQQPTNVLLLKNLSPITTEETVLMRIGSLTSLPIKSIRMIADNNSCPPTNVCSVELHSVYEASELFATISAMTDGFTIDNHLVTVSYGQRLETTMLMNAAKQSMAAKQNVAMAALAAAQWKNLDDSSKSSSAPKRSETVTVNGVEYTKYNPPDYNSFHYDATSGFYYDPSTGFYYDSNSQYFYNSQTQKYMYYDTTNQIYITVDSSGKATSESQTAASAASTKGTDLQQPKQIEDKAKMAKKIAKDMEKWAKMNQKKEQQLLQTPKPQLPTQSIVEQIHSETESPSANASFYVFEKQLKDDDTLKDSITISSDPFEIIKAEEERLIDRKRLACLLCKRQFNTAELLAKHQQLSGLHKTNLSVLRRNLLNEEQLEHVENVERESAYRDRAKERRDKFGIDDTPEYPKHKFTLEKEGINEPEPPPPPPISGDNIGNRMLKAMGWTEGTGLGKSNQGMSGIIEVERRKSGLGLGNQNATFTKETYKDAVRRTALQRFKEMNDK